MASHSEFTRLEDRLDESVEKQIGRVETKLDDLAADVRKLAVFEERQSAHARQVDDLRASSSAAAERWETRAAGMAERFDLKVAELRESYRALDAKVEKYLQRYVGAGMVAGVGWAVVTHLWK